MGKKILTRSVQKKCTVIKLNDTGQEEVNIDGNRRVNCVNSTCLCVDGVLLLLSDAMVFTPGFAAGLLGGSRRGAPCHFLAVSWFIQK